MAHTWFQKPTELKAERAYAAFTRATELGCTLNEAITYGGSYVERMTNSTGYDGVLQNRTLRGIRRGLRATKQGANHVRTFKLHLPLMRDTLRETWLTPVATSVGLRADTPWQMIVDALLENGRADVADDVRTLFDESLPVPDAIGDKPVVDKRPYVKQPPLQIRAYRTTQHCYSSIPYADGQGVDGVRDYSKGRTVAFSYDQWPHDVLATRSTPALARKFLDQFDFTGTDYVAVSTFRTYHDGDRYYLVSTRIRQDLESTPPPGPNS